MAGARARMSLVLRRPRGGRSTASLETLALEAGMHPDLVLRLVRLGLIEPVGGTPQEPLFAGDAAARLARAMRLRRDFGIDYAGAVLASELLARIERLERRLERYEGPGTRRDSASRRGYSGGGGGTSVERPRARK
jgi:chaperone modulatory protein CbpM